MNNKNGMDETLTVNGIEYVGLKSYAETHGMDVKHLRRHVRKNPSGIARKWANTWMIERDCDIVLPDTKSRGRQRSDGRQRWVAYIDPKSDELERVCAVVGVDNVVNPRERAKQRRANANKTE